MTRRILLGIGTAFAVLLVTLVLLLAWGLGTQSGSRALWGGVAGALDGLSAGSVEGRFGGPLSIGALRYETDSLRLTIDSLKLDWSPAALFGGELQLRRLHVDGVAYTQLQPAPPAEDSEPFALPERLSLPLAIDLRDIVLRSLTYRSAPEAEPLRVDEATLAASFRDSELSIDQLAAHGPLFSVRAVASARTADDYPATASIDWQATPPELATLEGSLAIEGSLASLRMEQTIAQPYSTTQRVELRDLTGARLVDARIALEGTDLRAIGDALPVAALSGTLEAGGSVTDLRYSADLDLGSADLGALALRIRGAFGNQGLALEQLRLSRAPGDAVLEAAGSASLAGPVPSFDFEGSWRGLRWPLAGDPRFESRSGKFSAAGSAEDYAVELTTALSVPGQTDGQLTLFGNGSAEAFTVDDLRLALLDGSLAGRGELRWSPELRGAITLDGEGLDPALLVPDFPGDLRLALRAAGGVSNGAVEAELETLALDGSLRGRPLDLEASGALQNALFELTTLRVNAGDSRLSARGRVGDRVDLRWEIDSPDLADLLPGAAGSLAGSGDLGGNPSLPAVRGSLEGDALSYSGYALERLALQLDVDLERETPSQLELVVDDARLGGVEVNRLTVSGAGSRDAHHFDLEVDSTRGAAQLSLAGGLEETRWLGALTAGELRYDTLAAWRLAGEQSFSIGSGEQQLERGCWESGDARLCLQGRRNGDNLDAALDLSAFSLEYLRPLSPPALSLAGTVGLDAAIRQSAGGTPEVKATVNAEDVALRTGEAAEQPDELLLALQPSSAWLTYGAGGLRAELALPFVDGGGIEASAEVEAGSDALTERPLRATLALALDDIGFLNALSTEIDQAGGALTGDFSIGGTLGTPLPEGELRLADGTLALGGPGLDLSAIGLVVASADGTALTFDGRADSGGGTLRLGGSAQLDGAATSVDLDIDGDRFEVVNTVDARVFVSPELQVSLREAGITVSGTVRVPRAEITPKELPQSVVTASGDEVIVAEDTEGAADAVQRELDATIRVVLGDAVTVDGFGFKGRLDGALTVTQRPGQPTLGSGDIRIVDGEYRAYGQGLVVDRGRILFAGGPVDQPGIDVRALRRPAEGIVVGVRVQGPLQEPDFSVFSEPGMSQAEQLSWLVLGRPLEGASEGESDMIAQAALALGLRGGNFLADRFGGELGVDTVGIETGSGEAGAASDVNQAAFVIGKYLSPDLFVSYGIGLFDSVSTIRLEYSLSEHWKVSTESSTLSSGGDVHYTIER